MPKRFAFFLIIAQLVLTILHWFVYKLAITIFPSLYPHHILLETVVLLLSFSFLCVSALSHYWENWLIRIGYVIFSMWLVFALYFAGASVLALLISFLTGWNLQTLGLLALAVAMGLTLYGLINARITRVVSIRIKLRNLPAAWVGKTAVLASDIHLGHILKIRFAKKIVGKINALNPEIVFIPGDFYDGEHTNFQELADEFKKLKATWGTYYSSGNHELYAGYTECEAAIKKSGIKILEDAKQEVHGVQLLGLAYKFETAESVSHRLKIIEIDPSKPSILLKHVPNHLHSVEQNGVNLQLSGHTHLGQVWPFRYITKKVFKSYDYGLKTLGKMQIYTSSGVGTWGPPLRVFTKSEIVKITFEPQN